MSDTGWRHRERLDARWIPNTGMSKSWCEYDEKPWRCDAEQMRLRAEALETALRRLDHIARVDPLNATGEAELRAALDQSYWLLHPDERPSALDKVNRAEAEARAALTSEATDE